MPLIRSQYHTYNAGSTLKINCVCSRSSSRRCSCFRLLMVESKVSFWCVSVPDSSRCCFSNWLWVSRVSFPWQQHYLLRRYSCEGSIFHRPSRTGQVGLHRLVCGNLPSRLEASARLITGHLDAMNGKTLLISSRRTRRISS